MLSILMLTGAALLAGAIYLFRKGTNRKQAVLMVIAAGVMFANVGIWTLPTDDGNSLSQNKKAP